MPVFFWGIAKVLTNSYQISWGYALVTSMIGVGAVAAYLLSKAGWHSNSLPVGIGIIGIGVGQYIHGTWGEWATFSFAIFCGMVALAEVLSVPTARKDRQPPVAVTAPSDAGIAEGSLRTDGRVTVRG